MNETMKESIPTTYRGRKVLLPYVDVDAAVREWYAQGCGLLNWASRISSRNFNAHHIFVDNADRLLKSGGRMSECQREEAIEAFRSSLCVFQGRQDAWSLHLFVDFNNSLGPQYRYQFLAGFTAPSAEWCDAYFCVEFDGVPWVRDVITPDMAADDRVSGREYLRQTRDYLMAGCRDEPRTAKAVRLLELFAGDLGPEVAA